MTIPPINVGNIMEGITSEETKNFEFGAALWHLRCGRKVRLSTWPSAAWIELRLNDGFVYDNEGRYLEHITTECFLATDWELYNE